MYKIKIPFNGSEKTLVIHGFRILLALLMLALPSQVRSDSTTLKKVRDDYPAALSKLKSGYSSLEATGKLVQGDKEPPPERGNVILVSAKQNQRKVVMRSFEGGRTTNQLIAEVVYCIGDKASFTARTNLQQNRHMVSDFNLREAEPIKNPVRLHPSDVEVVGFF